jgi:hypothetical protein
MTTPRRAELLAVALFAAFARLAGALLIHRLGFSVVSDDDFARVVIAQKFAHEPHLDPTGTSWLPLPFWLLGGAMRLLGSSLEVARALAPVYAALGSALVAAVASLAGLSPARVAVASLAAALMPWGMQLAVATVPEAFAASCAAAGILSLASPRASLRWIGAAALLASTLSRYEGWPLAFLFAVITLFDALRGGERPLPARAGLLGAAALAVTGVVGWTLWQHFVFHDAFRYLHLVSSYRRALGHGPSLAERVLGYPASVVEEMREVFGAGIVALLGRALLQRHAHAADRSPRTELDWSRPMLLVAAQFAFLVYGDVRDGAPTHHPERALLASATVVLFAAADQFATFLHSLRSPRRRRVVVVLAASAMVGWIALRLHRSLRWYAEAPRVRELAAGRALAERVPANARVLVDTRDFAGGGLDYGYYAVLAAFARPTDAVVDRDQDPRKPRRASAFVSADALLARVAETGATHLLAWGRARCELALRLPARSLTVEPDRGADDAWCILALDARDRSP